MQERLRSQHDKLSELKRINPTDMAYYAQVGMISDIKEHELKLEMKHHKIPEHQDEYKPSKINRFELEEEKDLVSYQKKIQELQKAEKEKRVQSEFEAFRRSLKETSKPRAAPHRKTAMGQEMFYRRLLDQYEPISKDRAKEMLNKIDIGIKGIDAKVDEKPFDDNFIDYCEAYKDFMNDILHYHDNRMQQGVALQSIQEMTDIIGHGKH